MFAASPLRGNPVGVVLDADDLDDERMQRFATWANLSETVFLQRASAPGADYRARIFTTASELPFAGHPTLGACHAWLTHTRAAVRGRPMLQECGAGLVPLRADADGLSFASPPLIRSGPVDAGLRAEVIRALGLPPSAIRELRWVDNGPGWLGVLLDSADDVLTAPVPHGTPPLGLIGPYPAGAPYDFEVRAFYPDPQGMFEDPVTGSLNAAFGGWLTGDGLAPPTYTAHQGTVIGRDGRIGVSRDDQGTVWVTGATHTVITGHVQL